MEAMAIKTKSPHADLAAFLAGVVPTERQSDATRLTAIFADVTGFAPRLWGGAMIGFGRYAYQYDSGRSGEYFATGFAPRKAELVLYIMPGFADQAPILADLGTHRVGKSCLYLKRLDGVNEVALRRLIRAGLDDLATRWPIMPA